MRLLIIEDDPGFSFLVSNALKGLVHTSATASTWEDVETFFGQSHADLAWVDLRMPTSTESQSVERIKHLRKRFPDLLIIVGSGYITPGIRDELKTAGVDGFLYKSSRFDPRQVASLIVMAIMQSQGRGAKVDPALLPRVLEWMREKFQEKVNT